MLKYVGTYLNNVRFIIKVLSLSGLVSFFKGVSHWTFLLLWFGILNKIKSNRKWAMVLRDFKN